MLIMEHVSHSKSEKHSAFSLLCCIITYCFTILFAHDWVIAEHNFNAYLETAKIVTAI